MEPLLKDGDIVFFKDIDQKSELSIGDIVIINHPTKDIKLIKRITAFKGLGIKVSGDNYKNSDDSNLFGLIQSNLIIGKVTSHISSGSMKRLKSFLTYKK